MNGRFGHAIVPRNLRGAPWLDQGVVDNEKAVAATSRGDRSSSGFSLLQWADGGLHGSLLPCLLLLSFHSVQKTRNRPGSTEMMLCFPGFAQERCACVALA
jgi:hypothetical protein